MKNQDLIHIKVDYDELIPVKKEVLSIESDLIRIIQLIKRYHKTRMGELRLKASFLRRLKETRTGIKKLEEALPELKIPKEFKHNIETLSTSGKTDNLTKQLQEIQKRLKELEE